MFAGHFAMGLAARPASRGASLGTLILAAQLLDLLWPTFLLLGLERVEIEPGATRVTPLDFVSYPWSHSLVMAVGWGVALGLAYRLLRRSARGALVVAALVPSHWVLDAIAHRPDLPLVPGGTTLVGLGLWRSLPATLAVGFALLAVGLTIYLRSTRARDRAGAIGPWALAAVLLAITAGNVLGPPPPSVTAIAWVGQAQWLLVALGYWVDRHRVAERP